MTLTRIEDQVFPVEPVGRIEDKIAQGEPVSGGELLDAIEQSQGHTLPDGLRNVILKFSVSAVKRRGRPSISRGQEDFALREVDACYPALLRKYEKEAKQRRLVATEAGDVLPIANQTPSELAYTRILEREPMKHLFPNLDWRTLRNKHSAWINGHYHPVENDTGSEDYEDEIDRLFPSEPKSHLSS